VNVLQHLLGYRKNHLPSEDKAYRRYVGAPGLIEDYRQGLVPLVVPLTLLKQHLNAIRFPTRCLV
jgi:uncharacterized protein YbgA (DUF1722 family)